MTSPIFPFQPIEPTLSDCDARKVRQIVGLLNSGTLSEDRFEQWMDDAARALAYGLKGNFSQIIGELFFLKKGRHELTGRLLCQIASEPDCSLELLERALQELTFFPTTLRYFYDATEHLRQADNPQKALLLFIMGEFLQRHPHQFILRLEPRSNTPPTPEDPIARLSSAERIDLGTFVRSFETVSTPQEEKKYRDFLRQSTERIYIQPLT